MLVRTHCDMFNESVYATFYFVTSQREYLIKTIYIYAMPLHMYIIYHVR